MSIQERDRRAALVAVEHAVTWCRNIADRADRLLKSVLRGRRRPEEELQAAIGLLASTRRYLAANTGEVRRIRLRVGIA